MQAARPASSPPSWTSAPCTASRQRSGLLTDVEGRAGQVRDLGLLRVIECADSAVATLLSRDRTMRGLCSRIGKRHLILDPAGESKARAALRKLRYPVGPTTR